ncbi:MAG: hypothetical protein ACOC2F_00405 [Bacteroidota bacterium]
MQTTSKKIDLFLDSGAFSAKTQGVEIDIQEYIQFIKRHEKAIDVYANLDVIGSAEKTWENQMIMEKEGLHPLPVFHLGAPRSFLERYIDRYDYIALGGMVGIKNSQLIQWLDPLWRDLLTKPNGIPKVKVHGFGLTSLRLMLRYPWYSVDSTSWVVTGRLGGIYMPRFADGKWIYDRNSWKISVSNKSPDLKEAGSHIETLPPIQKQIVLRYIEEKGYSLGKSEFRKESQDYELQEDEKWAEKKPKDKTTKREVEKIIEPGISNKYQLRDEMNIIYFLDLEKSMPTWPWPFKATQTMKGFF